MMALKLEWIGTGELNDKGNSHWLTVVSGRRRHTRLTCDWSSDVCSSDLGEALGDGGQLRPACGEHGVDARGWRGVGARGNVVRHSWPPVRSLGVVRLCHRPSYHHAGTPCRSARCPGWDSNPHWTLFESAASAVGLPGLG